MTRAELCSILISVGLHMGLLEATIEQQPIPLPVSGPERASTEVELVERQPVPQVETTLKTERPQLEVPKEDEIPRPDPQPKPKKNKPVVPRPSPASPPIQTENLPSPSGQKEMFAGKEEKPASAEVFSTYNPKPPYPASARRLRREGSTLLRVTVSASGEPLNVSVEKSSGYPDLDESALQTVRRWKFQAGTRAGVAIESEVIIPIKFQLRD